jgi:hypothetical protein
MSRIGRAFSYFFSVLFKGKLPPSAVELIAEDARALPAVEPPAPAAAPAPAPAAAPAPPAGGRANAEELRQEGALVLLGLLQREGRLVDFLREGLDGYDDAAIGAAVRDIHRGCKKVLEDHVGIEPVMPGQEDSPVTVPRGFDPAELRIIGQAAGEPPWRGVLVHHGWRALKVKLPTLSEGVDRRVLAPAEVRVS